MKEEVCNCTRSGGIDEDIQPIVNALNAAGIETVASCCGHTFQPSSVTIRHNGVIKVLRLLTYTQARRIDRFFPGVNGERMYKKSSIANRKLVWSLIQDADALYDALADLVFLHGCEQEGIESGMPTPDQWTQAVDNAVIALKGAREKLCCNWQYVFAQRSFWKTECGYIADDPVGEFCPHCGKKIIRSKS